MISHPGVLESKGHSGVAVRTEGRDERRLDLVFFLEGNLVIAGVTVEETEQFTAGGGVYNLVYPRQTEGVFRAVFVEITVINAHSPFILFLNKNWVCQPLRMIHFFNKSGCLEPFYFYPNSLLLV